MGTQPHNRWVKPVIFKLIIYFIMEHDESDELVESCLIIANQDEDEEEDDVLEDYQDDN